MTDNEIIKALECCQKAHYKRDCIELKCPWFNKEEYRCCYSSKETQRVILDLINRQQAEIERLQGLLSGWKTEAYKLSDSIDNIKSEAIKEFAERLKEETYHHEEYKTMVLEDADEVIDNLVKEMGGEA